MHMQDNKRIYTQCLPSVKLGGNSPLCPFLTLTSFHHIKQVLLSGSSCAMLTGKPAFDYNAHYL